MQEELRTMASTALVPPPLPLLFIKCLSTALSQGRIRIFTYAKKNSGKGTRGGETILHLAHNSISWGFPFFEQTSGLFSCTEESSSIQTTRRTQETSNHRFQCLKLQHYVLSHGYCFIDVHFPTTSMLHPLPIALCHFQLNNNQKKRKPFKIWTCMCVSCAQSSECLI